MSDWKKIRWLSIFFQIIKLNLLRCLVDTENFDLNFLIHGLKAALFKWHGFGLEISKVNVLFKVSMAYGSSSK